MKKLIVYFKKGDSTEYVNLSCERIEERDGFIFAYIGNDLIGAFDLGRIEEIYLSERKTAL